MLKANLVGKDIEITSGMQNKTNTLMAKVSERYPPVSHRIIVSEEKRGIRIGATYHDNLCEVHADVVESDFYVGIKKVRDAVLRQLEKSHRPARPMSSLSEDLSEDLSDDVEEEGF
jgi:ribosome-associated translation inhibitor RaiA